MTRKYSKYEDMRIQNARKAMLEDTVESSSKFSSCADCGTMVLKSGAKRVQVLEPNQSVWYVCKKCKQKQMVDLQKTINDMAKNKGVGE